MGYQEDRGSEPERSPLRGISHSEIESFFYLVNWVKPYVATYNDFERRFAQFLDTAPDVLRFASLGTTEQGESGTLFRIDYLKPSGSISFYYPDWVAVQMTRQGEVNWIIETKGRVWEDTAIKDTAMRDWCARISPQTGQRWEYARVNQSTFEAQKPCTLVDATQMSSQGSDNMTRPEAQ